MDAPGRWLVGAEAETLVVSSLRTALETGRAGQRGGRPEEQFAPLKRLSARAVGATVTRRLEANVGAVIMLGTLVGLIVLIFALVIRFDPEARDPSEA